jgi:Adenylate and Guanylate cyclase catalytic domain
VTTPRTGLVAVLFTDLVSSTELMARLGQRSFDELRRRHFAALAGAVTAYGGEEVKNTGDGVMAVFPSATQAVDAAVAMQRATLRHGGPVALTMRVGVAVGDATLEAGDVFGAAAGDPDTAVFEAYAGDSVRLHVLAPWSEQSHVFSVEGHRWPAEPGLRGTPLRSSSQLGALDALTLHLDGGAGGPDHLTGTYLLGDHREPYRDAGQWGLLRVLPACPPAGPLRPLPGACPARRQLLTVGRTAIALPLVLAAAGLLLIRRRRAAHASGGSAE